MRFRFLPFLAALAVLFAAPPASSQSAADDYGPGPVYRIAVDGMIDAALANYIDRALEEAEADSAAAVVLTIDTFGGLVDAADQIVKSLLRTPIPTVAVLDKNAISAGAIISYATDRIYVTPGASMGAATAVDGTGEYATEKIQSAIRALIRSTAEANGHDGAIAEAMVDEKISIPGVTEEGELLTLSADEAVRLGVAVASVASTDEALADLALDAREDVAHEASGAEKVLRFLGSPVMASLLMLMMLGGLYFELQTPGVGFAGAMAVIGAGLFFAPHYLLGLAQSWEIALFVVGVILIAVEVFVTPGFGVFGISGIIAALGALFIALVPNIGFQFPTDGQIAQATMTLAATLVLLIVLGVSLAKYLPRSERFSRLVLADELSAVSGHISAATDTSLLGATGTAITSLRPAGTADIDGRRVDVVATGFFLDAGAEVEVTSVHGSVVEVRPVTRA
ncbi:MAG: NfeD family protein [Bacteroidota bacterium]